MSKDFITDASLPVPQPHGQNLLDAIKSGELNTMDLPLALAHMWSQRDELLELLNRARGYLAWHADEDGPTDCPPCADMLRDIDAAIAKAKGEG